ncbi:MAG TPA: type IX secretion system sortase PorU, partial [Ignavibacteriaceae bacterium]|nr:type IX secretion system sortase PorU [Ignavibacteriaceae bacterium]
SYNNYTDFPELAAFGDFGILRGLKTQTIRILPVKFDASSNKIRLYTSILFQINFSAGGNVQNIPEDELIKYSVINYDVAKNWTLKPSRLNKDIQNSVLANGQWVRFEATKEGIYKIDRTMLQSFGINPVGLDPRTIKIYNNGGKVLPESNLAARPIDLVENAITIAGENDGSFDSGDYILFYGRGSRFRDYDSLAGTIPRFNHPYSLKNYYWITHGGANGKRIQNKPGLNTTPNFVQSSSIAFLDFEEDKINLAKTGREFYGDDFSQSVTSRTYMNKLDGRLSSFPINYRLRFINGSSASFTFQLSENSTQLISKTLAGYGSANYTVGFSHTETASFTGSLPDNRSVLKFTIIPSSSSVGYLDYFEISFEKELKAVDDQLIFFSKDSSAIVEYYINGFSSTNIKVFDVSNYSDVKIVTNHILLSGGDCRFQFNETAGEIKKYYAVGGDKFFSPVNPQPVTNSNLRGIDPGAKFIIITHNNFLEAADHLKNYRQTEASLPISTTVIDVDQIYNEFSCGMMDVSAIRDFIRYAYENWQITPEYFLLFGKGTYDFKNIEGFGDNFIPTWQTVESLRLLDSYPTDDFFARVDGDDSVPDLAFGRITSRNSSEANNYINKVIWYETQSDKGSWRNLITLVADDDLTSGGSDPQAEHTRPSEILANTHIPASYDLKKIYIADYPAEITGSGRRKPTANTDIIKTMNEGTLFVNYIGHGNPDLWAHEQIFVRSVAIPQLENDRYFFLCAATCDFGYYDIPNFQSGAEEIMFLPNTGSIATFNSARLVFSGQNHLLNYSFFDYLLTSPKDTLNYSKTIGYAVFKTKVDRNSTNDRKFHLIGDPTLRLQIPRHNGIVDSVNSQLLVNDVQVKALSRTRIAGRILDINGQLWSGFNGEGILTVFDSERTKLLTEIGNFPMVIQGGVIFRGRVSVINGEFSADFVVPKDISYENKNGKIQFYFFDANSDGIAFTNKILVGGTDTTVVNDGNGPEIEIFFDDENYRNAYLVSSEPLLIIKLFDETGLNTTGTGVGHTLEGILNEDESNPLDFTNYFTGELDAGGREGKINYKFNTLQQGDYNLLVKAWDVFNNYSNESAYFTVVNSNELVVRDVYNYPNPFAGNTTFTFQQNLNVPVDVQIKVYTIAGRLVKEITEPNINTKFVKINWNGKDADGDILGNGSYFYKLIVRTTDGGFSQSVIGKMAVIK